MARPASGYRTADGTRVPGVTTIIAGLGWGKDALMWWAWNEGREGRDFRETKDAAADIGTVAHEMVEAHIHGREFDHTQFVPDLVDAAQDSYAAFRAWCEQVSLSVVATEVPLVSEQYRFGGTVDCVAEIGGKRVLLDWKTSKAVYASYVIQIAAYRHLWNELRPAEPVSGEAYLLRIGKAGNFAYHHFTERQLDVAWQAFLRLRDLYDMKKPLEEAA